MRVGGWIPLVALVLAGAPAHASELRLCEPAEKMVRSILAIDVGAHSRHAASVIAYASGTRRPRAVDLDVRVDASGSTVCYVPSARLDALDEEHRRVLLEQASGWEYVPFARDGMAIPVMVQEHVWPVELPARHRSMPEVSLKAVKLTLTRGMCLLDCPDYTVEVRGDGRVTYIGNRGVDVEGRHAWRIEPSAVATLVRSARDKDLWSLNSDYSAGVPDSPGTRISMDMGGEVHTIDGSSGGLAGMPANVTTFEDEIDRLSGAREWVRLSAGTLGRLQANGLRLDSAEAGKLLHRVAGHDDSVDDTSALRLIEGGAPIGGDGGSRHCPCGDAGGVLSVALRNRRRALVPALVARGALQSRGGLDQGKLDAAFRDAIVGGDASLVETIWNAGGEAHRPALTFVDDTGDTEGATGPLPVSLLLIRRYFQPPAGWDGFAVARWLVRHGVGLKGRIGYGDTLLHVAARAGDAAFVRYLLAQGFDVNAPGEEFIPPIYATHDEDVALMLLDAGADASLYVRSGYSLRVFAQNNRWWRVLAWLDAHPGYPG